MELEKPQEKLAVHLKNVKFTDFDICLVLLRVRTEDEEKKGVIEGKYRCKVDTFRIVFVPGRQHLSQFSLQHVAAYSRLKGPETDLRHIYER